MLLLTSVRWHHAEAFFKRPQRLFGSDFFVEKLLTLVVASGGVERSRLHRFELTQRELVKLVLQLPGARVVEALHCFGARCPLLVCLAQVRLGTCQEKGVARCHEFQRSIAWQSLNANLILLCATQLSFVAPLVSLPNQAR